MGWINGRNNTRLASMVVAEYGAWCWLCARPIDLDVPRRSSGGLSIDHVIPRSLGGSNELSNLRPAHYGCNSARGNRLPKPIKGNPIVPGEVDFRFFEEARATSGTKKESPPPKPCKKTRNTV